ncbi:hypothetical protein [Bacteroides nordii]|uniref:hypothetical protein n=1 Tax=Bacteroides nordii TaxID=291645 RepID=UPI002A7F29D2|nr:hypothetical protein [Bacteroides nordii]
MQNGKRELTIYWATKDAECIELIREKFNIPRHQTVNGETLTEIREEDMELLRETERRGFIQIRNKPQ